MLAAVGGGASTKALAGSLLPTYEDCFAILIKSNDQCCGKEIATTRIKKGGKFNEAMGEAGYVVALPAGCRQVGDRCKFGTFNRLHRSAVSHPDFNCGRCGVIFVDRCIGAKVKP